MNKWLTQHLTEPEKEKFTTIPEIHLLGDDTDVIIFEGNGTVTLDCTLDVDRLNHIATVLEKFNALTEVNDA